jgi:hypothetical protein
MSNDNDTVRDLKIAMWRRRTLTRVIHAVFAASACIILQAAKAKELKL